MSIGAEPNLNAYVNQMQSAEASEKNDRREWHKGHIARVRIRVKKRN